jgi:hypothetical protein
MCIWAALRVSPGTSGLGRVRLANGLAVGPRGWTPGSLATSIQGVANWPALLDGERNRAGPPAKSRGGAAQRWGAALDIRISLDDEG